MKRITTVTGDISANELGLTSMHEHIFYDSSFAIEPIMQMITSQGNTPDPEVLEIKTENMHFLRNQGLFYAGTTFFGNNDVELAEYEVAAFKKAGGSTIVDVTPSDIRAGSIEQLRDVSLHTGVNIVCSTGLYTIPWRDKFLKMDEQAIYDFVMTEISDGIDGSGIKPGLVKTAIGNITENGDIVPEEMRSLRACARAARDSGLGLFVHQFRPLSDDTVYSALCIVLDEIGVPADKVEFCHMDANMVEVSEADYANGRMSREPKFDLALRVLKRGASIGIDTFGNYVNRESGFFSSDDYDRIREIMYLVSLGYENQITLGHDCNIHAVGKKTGMCGYTKILTYAIPALRRAGCSEEVIRKLYTENPARILEH